jgi:hypothetical protein
MERAWIWKISPLDRTNVDVSASLFTRIATGLLALLWILLLLISAAGEKRKHVVSPWPLGGLGILRTPPLPAGRDNPSAFGIHLTHRQVIGHSKVMDALFKVEEKYPHVGASMLKTFLPGASCGPRRRSGGAAYEITHRSMTTTRKQGGRSWRGWRRRQACNRLRSISDEENLTCKFHYTELKRHYYPLCKRKCQFPEGPFAEHLNCFTKHQAMHICFTSNAIMAREMWR